ncbi:nitrate ABC transporter substrate-binding protein [Microbacterium memoriense]|uniref:Nitrate ABC transporter substrate-binding protein n=1 Tax=Microbacterium memoriense TaxID=2978350 RepID=A0ABT2PBS7_9MICO|nr:nitrate ABC transporter substrate-binding protein [Microbacterium memoriense]MCT9001478.1 nitrate ABC transporter substrate-binding protein [Microbacterium memoriense]
MASARVIPTAVLASLGALSLLLTGCATSAQPSPTETTVTTAPNPDPSDGAAEPMPTTTATAGASEATCDNLVSEEILTDLTVQGWTYRQDPFTVGDLTLEEGMQCMWADFTTASGNLLLFGWAPITEDEAVVAQDQLVAQGWTIEEASDGVYVTEDGMQAPTVDENGYGMTYEFGDGWVTVSDTKQNLLLIERPLG